jgi:SnoaL-like domain
MNRVQAQDWLNRYVRAWEKYDPEAIGDLFTDGARYRFRPHDQGVVGRDEIVREWMSHRTPDMSYLASYTPVAIDGYTVVAVGEVRYLTDDQTAIDRLYDSLFILTFADDGRCDELVEWFMLQPTAR